MVWLGYFFTVLNYACYCLSRFMKHKKMMLLLDLLAKVFTALGLYYLDSLSGAYIFMAVFFMLIIANIKERLNKKWLFGYIFFQSLYLAILFYTYAGISSILVVTTVSITLFCIWWLPPQQMRIVGGLNCFTYLAYQISIKNWAGLLEILVILSNLFSFLKYKKSDKLWKIAAFRKGTIGLCWIQPHKCKNRPLRNGFRNSVQYYAHIRLKIMMNISSWSIIWSWIL